jgi:hypothetical protein
VPNDDGKLVSGVRLTGGNIPEGLELADAVRFAKWLARDNELLLVVEAESLIVREVKWGQRCAAPEWCY